MGASLFWGLAFGSIGVGYFVYGKKQQRLAPLACGIGLMVFPYFVASTPVLLLVGGILLATPFVLRRA